MRLREGADEFANAVFSGATLLLVPLNTDAEMQIQVQVRSDERLLLTLEYLIPFVESAGWFNQNDIRNDLAMSIVSHITRDLQNEQIDDLLNTPPQGGNDFE